MNENAENTCATAASREAMEKVCRFLKETGTYYLATADGEQPRVRPFGTIHIFDGKLYIQTGRAKDVSKQLAANPKFELCAFKAETGEWLRLSGELVVRKIIRITRTVRILTVVIADNLINRDERCFCRAVIILSCK